MKKHQTFLAVAAAVALLLIGVALGCGMTARAKADSFLSKLGVATLPQTDFQRFTTLHDQLWNKLPKRVGSFNRAAEVGGYHLEVDSCRETIRLSTRVEGVQSITCLKADAAGIQMMDYRQTWILTKISAQSQLPIWETKWSSADESKLPWRAADKQATELLFNLGMRVLTELSNGPAEENRRLLTIRVVVATEVGNLGTKAFQAFARAFYKDDLDAGLYDPEPVVHFTTWGDSNTYEISESEERDRIRDAYRFCRPLIFVGFAKAPVIKVTPDGWEGIKFELPR